MFDFRTVLISALAMFYRSCLRFFIVLTPLAPTSTHSTHLHTYTLHMRTVSSFSFRLETATAAIHVVTAGNNLPPYRVAIFYPGSEETSITLV